MSECDTRGWICVADKGRVCHMSRQLINEYRADFDQLKTVSGSRREINLRPAFTRLLGNWGKQKDLVFVEEFQRHADKFRRCYAIRLPISFQTH